MWSVEKSKELYGIENWGTPFFDINNKGNVEIFDPLRKNSIDLYELTKQLTTEDINIPVLLRFPDILEARISSLNECFNTSISDMNYSGKYLGVYPVKVNQERHLVEDLIRLGDKYNLGLECGSKPELLIALANINSPEKLIICNGFKDKEYIETALLSRNLGRNTIIVVDRFSELNMILELSKKHKIRPSIGLRGKLTTQGAGRWAESSGNKSKFGLTPNEIVWSIKTLKEEGLLDCLELLHFHIGSQVPSIQSIKSALKEGARFFAEFYNLGATPKYIDVGGGLGINYDGSGLTDSSVNYSDQEYANDVVYTIKAICEEKSVPHPNIITESGRALVAHTSVLVFNVLGTNDTQTESEVSPITAKDHQVLRDLFDISNYLKKENLMEAYNDLTQIKKDVLQLFTYGVLSLKQRALAEEMINNSFIRIRKMVSESEPGDFPDLVHELDSILCESYFCNFSVFQSLPDSWAMEQIFPVIPIHRHDEIPNKRAVLVDLTCDSDGTVDFFIDPTSTTPQRYLEVHSLKSNEPYYMAAFLTGAYQEILGDLHNLFGDTDAVHVKILENGKYSIDHIVTGETISDVLTHVSFEPKDLLNKLKTDIQNSLESKQLSETQAKALSEKFKSALSAQTYLK